MDIQKGGQALKECIKEKPESLKNSKRFSALIDDYLGGFEYRVERTVLKHAVESYVLRSLFESAEITADSAERAVEEFKRESRMTQEDAEFTVKCIIIARGGNPDIVTGAASQREEEEKRKRQEEEQKRQEEDRKRREEQKRREEELRRKEEEQKRREEELKRREEEWKRREEEQRSQEEDRKRREEQKRREEELRRKEEEQKRREEELKRREEEQRRREEEQRRQEEERKRREIEQRRQEEERKCKEDQSNQARNESSVNFIVQACQKNIKHSSAIVVGTPISMSSKKYKNAKNNLNIPYNEEIFLVYDPTFLGSCKEGFAVCTSGIYGCIRGAKENKFISWEKLKMLNIYSQYYPNRGGLMIGKDNFSYNGSDSIFLAMFLADIQGKLKGICQNNNRDFIVSACNKANIKESSWIEVGNPISPSSKLYRKVKNKYRGIILDEEEVFFICIDAAFGNFFSLCTSGVYICEGVGGQNWQVAYIPWVTVSASPIYVVEKFGVGIVIGDVIFFSLSSLSAVTAVSILEKIKEELKNC